MSYKLLTKALSRALRTPQYLILFVNDVCWMKCHHCWFSEEWKEEHTNGTVLSFDELGRLARSIDRLQFLSLTGGEAFMRRDIVEVADLFCRTTHVSRYQIPTSGYATDSIVAKAELMLRNHPSIPFRVDVSLDGTEATHDHVRNRSGAYANATATVRALNRLRSSHPHFDVGIITTISRDNQHEVDAISRVVHALNPDGEWMVNIVRGAPRDPGAIDVDYANYIRAHELIEEHRRVSGPWSGHRGHTSAKWLSAKNAARRQLIVETLAGMREGGGCAAGALGGVVLTDGSVYPCEMLDMPFGRLQDFDYDLRAVWASERADEVRDWIQEERCICTQECFLSMSMLIQPRQVARIAGQRTKMFAEELRHRLRGAQDGRPAQLDLGNGDPVVDLRTDAPNGGASATGRMPVPVALSKKEERRRA
jgi:MoaA/NifB/PqqE/SkfB family radical SAM enzyme